jgi:hypothetical protein
MPPVQAPGRDALQIDNAVLVRRYLMWECRLTLLKAYALLHFKIPDLKISPRISAYLVHYEAILYGVNSMVLQDGILVEQVAPKTSEKFAQPVFA